MVDIAAEVGYEHPASFTRAFKAAYGDAPLKLRRAAQHSTLLGHIGKRRV
jgi:AraC-like DNA-binding protein